MATWNLLLYALGALLALRSLLSLMAQHKQHLEHAFHLEVLNGQSRKPDPPAREASLSPPGTPQGRSNAA